MSEFYNKFWKYYSFLKLTFLSSVKDAENRHIQNTL
jgi:hypothetical protein